MSSLINSGPSLEELGTSTENDLRRVGAHANLPTQTNLNDATGATEGMGERGPRRHEQARAYSRNRGRRGTLEVEGREMRFRNVLRNDRRRRAQEPQLRGIDDHLPVHDDGRDNPNSNLNLNADTGNNRNNGREPVEMEMIENPYARDSISMRQSPQASNAKDSVDMILPWDKQERISKMNSSVGTTTTKYESDGSGKHGGVPVGASIPPKPAAGRVRESVGTQVLWDCGFAHARAHIHTNAHTHARPWNMRMYTRSKLSCRQAHFGVHFHW